MLLAALLAVAAGTGVELRRIPAPEANQGVVADRRYLYAIDNAVIARYDRTSGARIDAWTGDRLLYKHMNSCSLNGRELVCAASNYPDVPMASSIERFDVATLKPIGSRSLGPGRGSLTWLQWHDGSWWACFANYSERGGEPGRDNRWTTLVRYSRDFVEQGAWLFPAALIAKFAPMSSSGGAWNADGLLYVTGHDLKELYALRLPKAGSILEHVATFSIPTEGQAIAWDPIEPRTLWSIARKPGEMVATRIPPVDTAAAD